MFKEFCYFSYGSNSHWEGLYILAYILYYMLMILSLLVIENQRGHRWLVVVIKVEFTSCNYLSAEWFMHWKFFYLAIERKGRPMLLHVDGNYFRLHKQGIKDEILVGQYLDSLTDHKTSCLDLFQLNFWIVAGKSNREENCVRFFTWTPQLGMANAWPSQCYPNATVLYCSIIRILVFGYPSVRCHSSVKASQFNSPQSLSYFSCHQHLSILLPDEAVSGTTLAYCPRQYQGATIEQLWSSGFFVWFK